jgi:hypothetical protein
MHKIVTTITAIVFGLMLTGTVFAAVPNLSIKMEQPKTPTNISDLKLTVVTLDRQGRELTVKCYKKGPSDGGFSQFGADITINPAGGNSVTCNTNSSIMNTNGTYQFYATTQADAELETSNTVTVDYNTSGPGTPGNYSKETSGSCDYKIKFHTADDAGKTVKVEVYRSENTSFTADNGTRVDTVVIGSNTDGQSITTKPDCSKTYYFAVRAFDSAGNGSGVVGDSEIHVTTTSTTTTSGTTGGASGTSGGAIPAGTAGNVLGQGTGPSGGAMGPSGTVMGESTPSAETITTTPDKGPSKKTIALIGGAILLLIAAWMLRKKNTQK